MKRNESGSKNKVSCLKPRVARMNRVRLWRPRHQTSTQSSFECPPGVLDSPECFNSNRKIGFTVIQQNFFFGTPLKRGYPHLRDTNSPHLSEKKGRKVSIIVVYVASQLKRCPSVLYQLPTNNTNDNEWIVYNSVLNASLRYGGEWSSLAVALSRLL